MKGKTFEERFWEKVDIRGPDECWPWKRGKTKQGYGKVGLVLGNGKHLICHAHKIAYILENGSIEYNGCHTCDNPICCNPKHVFDGTQTVNLEDMTQKGRRRYRAHPKEENGRAKIKQLDVDAIRNKYQIGKTRAEIAREYSLNWTTVDKIVKRKLWR